MTKLTSESMHEILWCDHSYETSSAVLSHGAIQYSTFESVHEFLWCDHSYETCLEVLLYGSMDTLISQEFSKA